jgi:hypothetical protein
MTLRVQSTQSTGVAAHGVTSSTAVLRITALVLLIACDSGKPKPPPPPPPPVPAGDAAIAASDAALAHEISVETWGIPIQAPVFISTRALLDVTTGTLKFHTTQDREEHERTLPAADVDRIRSLAHTVALGRRPTWSHVTDYRQDLSIHIDNDALDLTMDGPLEPGDAARLVDELSRAAGWIH